MSEQPDLQTYGVSELALFPTYTRDTYLTKFGVQAPPFDSALAPKAWLDTTALVGRTETDLVTYNVLVNNTFTTISIPASDAATVNLTGRYDYPAYSPASTVAVSNGTAVSPSTIIAESDVKTLVTELITAGYTNCTYAQDETISTTWGTETRRRFIITVAEGVGCDAALLLADKYTAGVGAPGHWVMIAGSAPIWVVDAQDDGSTAGTATPVPVRLLLSNETLVIGWAGLASIVRTDLVTTTETTTTSTGLTEDQISMLTRCDVTTAAMQTQLTALSTQITAICTRLGIK